MIKQTFIIVTQNNNKIIMLTQLLLAMITLQNKIFITKYSKYSDAIKYKINSIAVKVLTSGK